MAELQAALTAAYSTLASNLASEVLRVYQKGGTASPQLLEGLRVVHPQLYALVCQHQQVHTALQKAAFEREAQGRLSEFRQLLGACRLVDAYQLLEAIAADQRQGGEGEGEAAALDEEALLRPFLAEVAQRRDQLLSRVLQLTVGAGGVGGALVLQPLDPDSGAPVALAEIWAVSDSLGDLGPLLQAWAARIYEALLLPWIQGRLDAPVIDRLGPSSALSIALHPATEAPSGSPPLLLDGTFVRALTGLLEVLAQDVLGSNPTLLALFGREWADAGLAAALHQHRLSPGGGVALDRAEAAVASAALLDSRLESLGYVEHDEGQEPSPTVLAISSLRFLPDSGAPSPSLLPRSLRVSPHANALLERSRTSALGPLMDRIAALLQSKRHLETPEGDRQPAGRLISWAAQDTWETVRSALEQAIEAAEDQGKSRAFASSVKAAVEGFTRGLPQRHEEDFQAAQISLLHASGCEWLWQQVQAHEKDRTQRGVAYPPWLRTEVTRSVAALKKASLEFIERPTHATLAEVAALLDPTDGLRDLGDPDRALVARQAVQQVLFLVGRSSKSFQAPLSDRLYGHTAAALVEGVCRMVINALLHVGDLSVKDSEALPAILRPLADDLLGQVTRPGKAHSRVEVFEEVSKHSSSVSKLLCLLDLTRLKLAEIVAEWQAGTLRRRGVTREEVATLIESLFSDTHHRREALKQILV